MASATNQTEGTSQNTASSEAVNQGTIQNPIDSKPSNAGSPGKSPQEATTSETPNTSKQNGCRPKIHGVRKKQDHTLCSVCVEIGKSHPTEFYCFDCGRTLCEYCDLNHRQISAFREHVKISLAEGGGNKDDKLKALICKEHDRMVRKYCWECEQSVCTVCLTFEHHTHTIRDFAIKTSEQEEEYQKLQEMIEKKMGELRTKMDEIQTMKERQAENYRQIQEKIKSHTENMMNQVCVQEHQLMEQVNREHQQKQHNLADVQKKVDRAKSVIDYLMKQAGVVEQKQAELAKLKELREQLEQGIETSGGATLEALKVDALEELDDPELEIMEPKPFEGSSEALAEATADDLGLLPNFDDPQMMLANMNAIINALSQQIPQYQEETEKNLFRTTFTPGTEVVSIGSLQMPDINDIVQMQGLTEELAQIKQLTETISAAKKSGPKKSRPDKKKDKDTDDDQSKPAQ